MNRSRLALSISVLYTLPLLAWLLAQLGLNEWTVSNLQPIFRRTLFGLLLLQSLTCCLVFIGREEGDWRDDALAMLQIVLYPLPFLTLIWLSGSASLSLILKGMLLVALLAALTLSLQRAGSLIPKRIQASILVAPAQLGLAVAIWNFRDLWWGWLTR